jgi:hypothetical protein
MHPWRTDWDARWTHVNGAKFNYRPRDQRIPHLPPFFPRVRPSRRLPTFEGMGPVALSLSGVEPLAKRVREAGISAKRLLGLAPDQLLVVLGFEHDRFLEHAWPPSRRRLLLEAIKVIEPDAAVAWNYSCWYQHPAGWEYSRADQVYNIKRSMRIYADLQAFGVPAIPHVYWADRSDLDRWDEWLVENPQVRTIAIDLQTLDVLEQWSAAVDAIRYLAASQAGRIQVLFSGAARPERMVELARIWPSASFTHFAPYFAVLFPRKPRAGMRSNWTRVAGNPAAVLRTATFEYDDIVRTRSLPQTGRVLEDALAALAQAVQSDPNPAANEQFVSQLPLAMATTAEA